jgi:hypothetical protein
VPGYKYQMQVTWRMQPGATPQDVVNWILYAADHSREMRLDNVILNCHGRPGELAVGGKDPNLLRLNLESVGIFSMLRDTDIDTIWLVSCDVAEVETGTGGRDGKRFCSELARTAGCDVVAAAVKQRVEFGFYLRLCPWGCIDDFEGVAYRFGPAGGYTWFSHNGHTFKS